MNFNMPGGPIVFTTFEEEATFSAKNYKRNLRICPDLEALGALFLEQRQAIAGKWGKSEEDFSAILDPILAE